MRESRFLALDGPVHYVDYGGTGPDLLLIHGLGGSHLNWEDVTMPLSGARRVVAIDLVGFGLTPPAGRRADLETQVATVVGVIEQVLGGTAALMGNSMGGLIAMIAAAEHPHLVSELVLVNPALLPTLGTIAPQTLARLGLPLVPVVGPILTARHLAATPPEQQVTETFEFICSDPARVSAAAYARSVEMTRLRRDMSWALDALVQASRSTATTLFRTRRFREEILHRISAPTLLVHGEHDPLVPLAAAQRIAEARPDWTLEALAEVGHVPMLEVAEEFAALVLAWLAAARV